NVFNPTDGVEVVSAQAYALVPTYRAYAVVNVPVGTVGAYLTMQQLGFDEATLRQSDLVVFRISYSFKYFDPEFDYRNNVRPVLWVFGWVDLNGDGRIQTNELIWYNYGYQRGTEVEVPMAKLGDRMQPGERLIIRVDVRPTGAGPYPAAVPVTVEAVAYKRAPAPDISVSPSYAVLKPGSGETFAVTVRPPADAAPTAFERVVVFTINGTTYVVPLSYTVVRQAPTALTAGRTDSWYNASALRGGNDWGWRYESGDWRAYYIVSSAPNLDVSFSWQCANTSLAAYALTGDGFFAGYFFSQGISYSATTYIGSGVFLWASTGGATRLLITPSSNFAVPIQAVGPIYATMSASWPVQSAGLYILLVRTTNYGGCGTAEALSGSTAPLTAGPSVPTTLMPGLIKANLGIPSLPYLFAVKSAAVLGGGYVVPSYTIGLDLKFRDMVYVP
ncbi:MAG: peptidase S8, partial [Thermoproteus sp.]|nr:peptidase S8 [Thermoproteus sp.]